MFLRFEQHGRKWYARTPEGEYAWGELQGLYEWRSGKRIDYTGGDRQCSSRNGMWSMSGAGEPKMTGLLYAVRQYKQGRN